MGERKGTCDGRIAGEFVEAMGGAKTEKGTAKDTRRKNEGMCS